MQKFDYKQYTITIWLHGTNSSYQLTFPEHILNDHVQIGAEFKRILNKLIDEGKHEIKN